MSAACGRAREGAIGEWEGGVEGYEGWGMGAGG